MTDRREFVRRVALVATAAAVPVAGPVLADEPKKPAEPKAEPARSEVDARMEVILARFGKHLDDDARKAVRGEVEALVRRAEALRKFPLDNGDGPFPVFKPYRSPL
jgi:hypothetical protein